jgi:hypothetical protein
MRAISALIAVLFYLFFASFSFAARSLVISSDKSSLFGDEEMVVTASASGFTDGETIYIKGAFYQEISSPNYFGYTKNGDSWIKNSSSTLTQKSIKIGAWDGNLSVKSDFSDSGFKGEQSYKLKVGFYYINSNGNPTSINWSSNSLDIDLNEPDPTSTPTPAPTSTPTPTSSPTSTPTPTKAPTPTLKPSVSPTPKTILPTDVLGESTQSGEIISNNSIQSSDDNPLIASETKNTGSNLFQKILIFIGVVFIVTCAILTSREIKKKS